MPLLLRVVVVLFVDVVSPEKKKRLNSLLRSFWSGIDGEFARVAAGGRRERRWTTLSNGERERERERRRPTKRDDVAEGGWL